MSVLDKAIVRVMPAVPKPVVRRISARYIAGPELEDACRVVRNLNTAGKMATIDVLGEEITRVEEARTISRAYQEVFDTISEQALDSNVSVKLTGLGLKLDYGLCRENLERGARRRRRARQLRPHRHGGLVDDRRHAAAVPRPARGGARQRRHRAAGLPTADARRHPGARRPGTQPAALQGHLRRAA